MGAAKGHRSRARVTKERQAREVVPLAAGEDNRVPILQEIGARQSRASCRKCRKGSRETQVGAAALPHAPPFVQTSEDKPPPPRRRHLQKSVKILRKSRLIWPVAGSKLRRSPRRPRHPGIARAPCAVASGAGSPSCASSGRGRGKSSRNGGKVQNGGPFLSKFERCWHRKPRNPTPPPPPWPRFLPCAAFPYAPDLAPRGRGLLAAFSRGAARRYAGPSRRVGAARGWPPPLAATAPPLARRCAACAGGWPFLAPPSRLRRPRLGSGWNSLAGARSPPPRALPSA